MYINHRQGNWLEWLATTKFVFNNKIYLETKLSLFKVNYGRKLRISFKIRKKEKNVKVEAFVSKIKKITWEGKSSIIRRNKKYINRNRKEIVEYKIGDKVLLSMKKLVWQTRGRRTKKLVERFVRS